MISFAGLAAAPTGPYTEPPDPWVAVGPDHLVQAVNTTLRFSSRNGSLLFDVSFANFFLEPPTEVGDSDPRVLYDAANGRWIASELSWDCGVGNVRMAVSNTSDPTAGWLVWDFAFTGSLPDYPGLGFSADKIVFTANHFALNAGSCTVGSFTSADVYAVDWTSVLGGGSISSTYWAPVTGSFAWRPAANLTADSTIHLIAMGPADQVIYGTITGTNASGNLAISAADLTTAGVLSAFETPPIPQDPLGPLGPVAVDGRPTDAIWQAGNVWFVSTYPHSYDSGTTYQDAVRITELNTTGSVSLVQDMLLGVSGFDAYMGGIGLSQAGGLYAVYTESNSLNYASLYAAFQGPQGPIGDVQGYRLLAAGQAGYLGVRWGDYVGVATDPVDPYAVWQAGEYANAVGLWSTHVSMLTQDRKPGVPTGVAAAPGNMSAVVSWSAPADPGSSPITGYTATSSPGGKTCTSTGTLSCTVSGLTNGTSYTFTVTAINAVGTGPSSVPSAAVTPRAVPGAPTAVVAAAGNASAVVSWSAPSSNGGSPITGYAVTSSPGSKTCTTTGTLSCTVTGLTNRTAYTFTVTATNGIGISLPSAPSPAVTPLTGATYVALNPARLVDSRIGLGISSKLTSHVARTFAVTGRGGVPVGAVAVTGNLTVTGQTAPGHLFLGPMAIDYPTSSTLNFPKGDNRANGVTVALGTGGTLSVTYASGAGQTTHVVFDVTGYFTSP